MPPRCWQASGRAGKITAKVEQLRFEFSIGKIPCRLAPSPRGVVGEMSNRATVLDRSSNLPDLRHVPPTGATLPGLVHQLHINKEVDVVGDLAVSLLDREHTTLRDSGGQAVDGRLR